ncbi:MAG: hypothetical protein FIA99_09565 [Ruminiclostridium sp.]|nr:hypothetical protein [Ruminiclostridium sp.]
MKKYMIRSDIEGVSGVVSYEQAEPGKPEYGFGQRMLMADLSALIKGLNDGGADEIVIYDEHYYGRNIDISALPANVSVICGKPPYRKEWAGGLDRTFEGLILLGLHSKFETSGGLLPHSYELDIKNIVLNGIQVGEIGLEAAIAGDYDIPLLLVTGDSAGVEEAKALIPNVETVTVKEAICEWGGRCFPQEQTSRMIHEKAREIVHKKPMVKPFAIKSEVTLQIEFNKGFYLDAYRKLYPEAMPDGSMTIIKGANVTDAWSVYWERKIRCTEYISLHIPV